MNVTAQKFRNTTNFGRRNTGLLEKAGIGVFVTIWILGALASIGVSVAVIFGIVKLVEWVTTK